MRATTACQKVVRGKWSFSQLLIICLLRDIFFPVEVGCVAPFDKEDILVLVLIVLCRLVLQHQRVMISVWAHLIAIRKGGLACKLFGSGGVWLLQSHQVGKFRLLFHAPVSNISIYDTDVQLLIVNLLRIQSAHQIWRVVLVRTVAHHTFAVVAYNAFVSFFNAVFRSKRLWDASYRWQFAYWRLCLVTHLEDWSLTSFNGWWTLAESRLVVHHTCRQHASWDDALV